jgi:hypothetical protein
MPLTREEARYRGRLGAAALHSRYPSAEVTGAARKAFLDSFERRVDPDGALPIEERARRAAHARTAHFLRLAKLSADARRRKAAGAA